MEYDMVGNAWEWVMGDLVNTSGQFYSNNDGFTKQPDEKYYDKYEYNTSYLAVERGHLGDATREVLKSLGSTTGGWYGDFSSFPNSSSSWIRRGGRTVDNTYAGIFSFDRENGGPSSHYSFRIVLTAQDGNS